MVTMVATAADESARTTAQRIATPASAGRRL